MQEEKPLPPRVPWRGSRIDWIQGVTTTALGVGRDNIGSEHEAYSMVWRVRLNYFVVDQDKWSVSVRTDPTWYVELTNSDSTTTEREPQFLDLPVTQVTTFKAFRDGNWSTALHYGTSLIFPTWVVSHNRGTHLNTSNSLAVTQGIPVLGDDAPLLKSVSLSASVVWSHRFGSATTAVNEDLDRPRQDLTGASFLDDQLGGGRFANDTLKEGISISFSEKLGDVPVGLGAGFVFGQQFKPAFPDSCVSLDTGVACVQDGADNPEELHYYGFQAAIDAQPIPEAAIELSYSSGGPLGQNTLGADGQHRSIFYSPSAEFGLTLSLFPDALYERLTGPARSLGTNTKKKRASF